MFLRKYKEDLRAARIQLNSLQHFDVLSGQAPRRICYDLLSINLVFLTEGIFVCGVESWCVRVAANAVAAYVDVRFPLNLLK